MFCKNCGADMKGSQTCPVCNAKSPDDPSSSLNSSNKETLPENIAGLLCYLLGWLTGIIFIIIDRRPSVRFHAMQSIITFGGLSILTFVFNCLISIFPYTLWKLLSGVNSLISLGSFLLGIFLMIQAYNGKQYKLPFVSTYVDQFSNKINFKG